jgi:hypothetical protein
MDNLSLLTGIWLVDYVPILLESVKAWGIFETSYDLSFQHYYRARAVNGA